MTSDYTDNIQFVRPSIHFGVRYNFLFNPIDPLALYKIMKSLSYSMNPAIEQNPSVESEGIIGQKDGFLFSINRSQQIIALDTGKDSDIVSEFDNIEQSLSKELGINFESNSLFSEVIIHYIVKTGNNPLSIFENLGNDIPLINDISSLFKHKVSPTSLKISPSLTNYNSLDWFDFIIEPLVNNSEQLYHVGSTVRNTIRPKVIEFLNKHKQIISDSLKMLERYNPNKPS